MAGVECAECCMAISDVPVRCTVRYGMVRYG